jgi:iron complex outermembrane receptor protein
VIVTGVRGVRRTVADSPAPVDVISSEQLTATGKVGLKEVLNTLIPSFNLPGINGGGTSWTVRAITMRGLNGDQALFLVNGKRRHGTALINNLARVGRGGAPVDLDLIPASAIERIEVLRDGASAQYGSDAIAGVVNIILKKDARRRGVQLHRRPELSGRRRHPQRHPELRPAAGRQGGFVQLALNWKNNEAASRSVPSRAQYIYQPTVTTVGGVTTVTPDPRDATADRYYWGARLRSGRGGHPGGVLQRRTALADLTLYSTSTLSHRSSKKNTGSFLPNLAPVAGVTAGRPQNRNSLPEVYPDGFNALRRIFELDFQTTWARAARPRAGTGTCRPPSPRTTPSWTARTPSTPPSVRQSDLFPPVDPPVPAVDHQSRRHPRVRRTCCPEPVQVSWGLEQRYEHFLIEPGDEASYIVGDYVIPAGQPFAGLRPNPGLASYAGTAPEDAGSVSRNVYAAYVDVGTNLTDTWYVGVAGRYERYTGDVGDTTSGKLTTRWEFLPGYAVRATVSNGFRAPSLAQTGVRQLDDQRQPLRRRAQQRLPRRALRGGRVPDLPDQGAARRQREAQALGATPLKPETSTNYSFGITAEPTSRLRITLDAYQIDIDDRIVDTSNLDLSAAQLASQPALAPLLARFPQGLAATYYTNAVSTRTTGVDLVGEYAFDLGDLGTPEPQRRLRLQQDQDHQADRHARGAEGGQSEPGAVRPPEDRRPDHRHAAQEADPRRAVEPGHVTASLRTTRYGQYTEAGTSADLDRTYSPSGWPTSTSPGTSVTTNVAIGANNLFDEHPDKIGIVNADTGMNQFGIFSPFGITGGYYYARLTQRF